MSNGDQPEPGPEGVQTDIQSVTADAAAAASETVSATADALKGAISETGGHIQAAIDRSAAIGSEASAAMDGARSRLERDGLPGAAAGRAMTDQFKTGADLLSRRMTQDLGQSQAAVAAFSTKVVEAWRANAESTIAYWQRVCGVTNVPDLIALNSAHLRQQIELMTAQARELAELAGQAARVGPGRFG